MATGYKHQLPGQFVYEDMLLSDYFPVKNVLKVQSMELEPSDVIIASYPKTGTTLVQELVWLIRNNGNTELANTSLNINRVPFLELEIPEFNCFQLFESLPRPRHAKTHLPYELLPKTAREGKTKIVYSIRNPKDQLVSYYHFHRANVTMGHFEGNWEDFFEYFKENDYVLNFGNIFDHMREYWIHKNDENLFIITFEELIKERKKCVRDLATFLDCELSDEVVDKISDVTSFTAMKDNPMVNMVFNEKINREPFMRKGKVGDWNYFTEEQNEIVDNLMKERLAGTDLEFVYE